MGDWVRLAGWSVASALKSRRDLTLENVALRHQLMVLQRQPGKPRLKDRDRLFWIWLRRVWPGWSRTLLRVHPATVVNWHRNGFRAYWRWRSRPKGGRPRIDPQGVPRPRHRSRGTTPEADSPKPRVLRLLIPNAPVIGERLPGPASDRTARDGRGGRPRPGWRASSSVLPQARCLTSRLSEAGSIVPCTRRNEPLWVLTARASCGLVGDRSCLTLPPSGRPFEPAAGHS